LVIDSITYLKALYCNKRLIHFDNWHWPLHDSEIISLLNTKLKYCTLIIYSLSIQFPNNLHDVLLLKLNFVETNFKW